MTADMSRLPVRKLELLGRDDMVTDPRTSARLSKVPRRDTRPEKIVRATLRDLGYSYRLHSRRLPGTPDIVNRSKGWAVFVHGCFWHSHRGCVRATVPKRNSEFWISKLHANSVRDKRVVKELEALGFRVLTIWECQVHAANRVLGRFLEPQKPKL
jgi:DNA mismatch endonuclease Vsr